MHLPKPNPQSTIATNTAWEAAFLLFIAVCQVSILGICPSGPKQVHWKSKFVPFCCCKIGRNKILGIGRIWSFGVCQFSSPFLSGFCSETPGHSKKFQAWNICWVYDAWHVCIYTKISYTLCVYIYIHTYWIISKCIDMCISYIDDWSSVDPPCKTTSSLVPLCFVYQIISPPYHLPHITVLKAFFHVAFDQSISNLFSFEVHVLGQALPNCQHLCGSGLVIAAQAE